MKVSGDGHCILYTVPHIAKMRYSCLVAKLIVEKQKFVNEYKGWMSNRGIETMYDNYVINKKWDSEIGDMIPVFLAKILKLNIAIVCVNGEGEIENIVELMECDDKRKEVEFIRLQNNHYEPLKINKNVTYTKGKCEFQKEEGKNISNEGVTKKENEGISSDEDITKGKETNNIEISDNVKTERKGGTHVEIRCRQKSETETDDELKNIISSKSKDERQNKKEKYKKLTIVLPYISEINSKKIKEKIKELAIPIETVFKSNRIGDIFQKINVGNNNKRNGELKNNKSEMDEEKMLRTQGAIYQLSCKECNHEMGRHKRGVINKFVYIGETGREVKTRIAEHFFKYSNTNRKSEVALHGENVHGSLSKNDWELKILGTEINKIKRKMREQWRSINIRTY